MKNKKIFLVSAILFMNLLLAIPLCSQTIPSHFFGENAWMPDTIGNANVCLDPPCVFNGKLHTEWQNIKNSGASIIRFGGIAGDKNMPTNYQYIKMIDSIRSNGMEPVIQVPFYKYRYTAQQAANIVQYINITKARKIKYWIIGNEPDNEYAYTTASQITSYFKPFASAMKAVDPTILTVGPECAWFNQTIIDGLTTPNGPDDLTGTDAAGHFYLDIISFHTYPFNGSQTRAQVISQLTAANQLQANLIYLNGRINSCNAAHARSGAYALRSAITEANIDWQNSGTDNLNGVGANSFIGGQFMAEMMGIGMKNGLDFINVWSVIEGNNTALNIGYIDAFTNIKKSMYYHFQLLAGNFNGNYANGTTNQINVKSFGSKSALNNVVMIMNQELSTNYNFTLRLNTNAVTGSGPLKINIDAGIAVEYKDVIQNQSSILLTFDPGGVLIKKCIYSLAGQAALNLPPSCEIVTNVLPIGLNYFNAELSNSKEVILKWSTESESGNNYFTVQKTMDGINYVTVDAVNGAGTSNQTLQYQSVDKSPFSGLSYYRLKQTDYNGRYTYSDLKAIEINPDQFSFTVFPDPSDGTEINVKIDPLFNDEKNRELIIGIYDSQGKNIYSQKKLLEANPGNPVKIYPSYKLIPGVYLIVVSVNMKIGKLKFIVK